MMNYFFFFISAFILAVVFTKIIRRFALRYQILDYPEQAPERKIHQKPIPLLGGLALFFSFFLVLFFSLLTGWFQLETILLKNLIGLFLASLILMIGGILDDRYRLSPAKQFLFSTLAVFVVMASGIGIKYINQPFGQGLIFLEQQKIEILRWRGVPYYFSWPADLITFTWLMLIIYALKLLAGLDGLVPGITSIGALMIFCLCFFTKFYQPEVGILAIILAGASLGFLIFNFHPAKIFLGTSGETFSGFILGTLAIISGSKIATLLLVLGIPILDVVWVILRRIFKEHRWPFFADKKHLHFRLLEIGFSHRGAVIFLWALALFFGLIGVLFPTTQTKILALGGVTIIMIGLALFVTRKTLTKDC
ncbi:MAG: undecaprenyl/decaprenyl-phosphate alpha-N-acetylglucosaminyl 1-phosphate transferase [Patescibacteria group bacterium]|nr:undecaprenyl/decaprenyl-phosphate alpha-N-acetylglucosaminyl 1-phosphate transferase [Patescibacteria group bacterium]